MSNLTALEEAILRGPTFDSTDPVCLWKIYKRGAVCYLAYPSDKVPAELYGEIAWNIRNGNMDGWRLDGTVHQHLAWIAAFRAKTERFSAYTGLAFRLTV